MCNNIKMNNKIFISFILCSRKRPDLLLKLMQSVYGTSDNPSEIEFYIKFDDDDSESIARIKDFEKYPNVNIKIAPRLNGYTSIETFLNQMAEETNAEWVFFANDDAYLIGNGWDSEIKKIKDQNCIVYPNKHQLNGSIYKNAPNMAFYFIPNKCWKKYGMERFPHPYDTCLNVLLHQNQWKDVFIELHTVHDRDSEDNLHKHKLI